MGFPVELGLILLFSVLGGVLAVRFRQPSVLGLIVIGAIVGPHNLGIITDTSLINAAIEIGAILLLFTVGVEFSLQKLLNHGIRVIIIAAIKLGMVFLVSYYAAVLLGLGLITALYIGVILSITSTVIFIKILDQKGLYRREETSLLIAVLIIEDIYGVFALTFFSNLNATADLAPLNMVTKLIISLAIMAVAYLILQKALKPAINWLSKYSAEETTTFLSLGLCGGMSYLALLLNLSPSVGAFLAGNIVASLPNSKPFETSIHPFTLAFTSLFFFSIGTTVNFSAVFSFIWIILALFAVNIVIKFVTIGFGSYMFTGFTGRQAVFSSIAMLSVGEFSLLIAKESESVGLGIDLVSITASIIVLSSITMSLLLKYDEKMYGYLIRILPSRAKEDMRLTSKFLNSLSWRMIIDKVSVRKIKLQWKTVIHNMAAIFIIIVAIFLVWRYFAGFIVSSLNAEMTVYAAAIFLFLIIMFPALKVIRTIHLILRGLVKFIVRLYPNDMQMEIKIFRDIVIVSALFLALIIIPFVSPYTPGSIYSVAVLILFMLILILVLRTSSQIRAFTKKHKHSIFKSNKKYKLMLKKNFKTANQEGKNVRR